MATTLPAGDWIPLEEDGIHDAANPAIALLQQPSEALSVLAPNTAGNHVNWNEAVRRG